MPSHMDEVYRQPGFYWGREPNELCQQVLALFTAEAASGKKLVDLGSGEGRDAISFARRGFAVAALDASEIGLAKTQAWASDEGLPLNTIAASILDYRLNQPVNVLYSSGTLHYLPQEIRAAVFANYKEFTEVGGLNAFNVFVEKPFLPTPPDYTPGEYFFRSGELVNYYWDWEIVEMREIIFDCNSAGIPHRHAMDIMIARKPVLNMSHPEIHQQLAANGGSARG